MKIAANTPSLLRHPAITLSALALGLALAFGPLQAAPDTSGPGQGWTLSQHPVSFADTIARVSPAVVSIMVESKGRSVHGLRFKQMPDLPEDSPFSDFFKHFFDEDSLGRMLPESRGRMVGQGSGFIVDPSGYIVTNYHVVDGAEEVRVTLNEGSKYTAVVKGRDSKTDLALLKIDANKPLPYLEFGDSDRARVGDWVLAVGNPFGLGGSVSAGIISARGRNIQSGPYDDYLQVDAPINRGNSGGPLFDAEGRVIGVNTAIFSPSGGSVGIGFAIPSSLAKTVVSQLKEKGHIQRGWLGVQIQPVTEEVAAALGRDTTQGTLVASVLENSPAARAGMQSGDLILKVDGDPINNFKDLPRRIADTKTGTQVTLEILRRGQIQHIPVKVDRLPDDDALAKMDPRSNSDSPTDTQELGLSLAPLTPETRQRYQVADDASGVLVTKVKPGSPAEQAGIRAGNLISMVGQEQVRSPEELATKIRQAAKAKQTRLLLLVEREGEKQFVTLRFSG